MSAPKEICCETYGGRKVVLNAGDVEALAADIGEFILKKTPNLHLQFAAYALVARVTLEASRIGWVACGRDAEEHDRKMKKIAEWADAVARESFAKSLRGKL